MKTRAYISMDELVFENRNHSYGAYYLRMRNNKITGISLFAALTICAMMIAGPMLKRKPSENSILVPRSDTFDVAIYKPEDPVIHTDPPVQEMEHELERQLQNTTPTITRDEVDTAGIVTQEELQDSQSGQHTVLRGSDPGTNINVAAADLGNPEETEKPRVFVEEQPKFKGNLNEYISSHLKIPQESIDNGSAGKVYIQFVIGKNGKVREAKVVKSNSDDLFSKAALDVINAMPDWEPGKNNGAPCAVYFTLPFELKIQ